MNVVVEGDCLKEMRVFPDNHFSTIVTDPPYGLHFMGKTWDKYSKGKIKQGRKVPGSHTNSEAHEAGRYNQSLNDQFQSFMYDVSLEALRITKPGGHILMFGAPRRYHRQVCAIEDAGWEIRDCIMWLFGSGFPKSHNNFGIEGYGTALKPAYEPIIMAMKPCDGTFKQNVEKWGQAGINIDRCRIDAAAKSFKDNRLHKTNDVYGKYNPSDYDGSKGRWPANVMFDEEGADQLGSPSRFFYCAKASSRERNEGLDHLEDKVGGEMPVDDRGNPRDRFKKIAKNPHPTVKPLKLMEYLIKLVMPPNGGLLLDPFAGSGTTILAAKNLGFSAIGIEKEQDYVKIAQLRIKAA